MVILEVKLPLSCLIKGFKGLKKSFQTEIDAYKWIEKTFYDGFRGMEPHRCEANLHGWHVGPSNQ